MCVSCQNMHDWHQVKEKLFEIILFFDCIICTASDGSTRG